MNKVNYVSQLHLFAEMLILYVQCVTLLCTETTECGKTALFYDMVPLPTFLRLVSFTPTFNAPRFRKPSYRNTRPSLSVTDYISFLRERKHKCNVKRLRNSEKF